MTVRHGVITGKKKRKIKSILNGVCAAVDLRHEHHLIDFETDCLRGFLPFVLPDRIRGIKVN